MKHNRIKDALDICNKFPSFLPIQSQLLKIYISQNRLEEAINICKKFPDVEYMQQQLKRIYKKQDKADQITCGRQEFSDKADNYTLFHLDCRWDDFGSNPIRKKLFDDTFTAEDFNIIKTFEGIIDDKTLKILYIAAYHRMGMFKSALNVLKSMDSIDNKTKNKILNLLSSKNAKSFYDLGFYDKLINWSVLPKTGNDVIVKVKK